MVGDIYIPNQETPLPKKSIQFSLKRKIQNKPFLGKVVTLVKCRFVSQKQEYSGNSN